MLPVFLVYLGVVYLMQAEFKYKGRKIFGCGTDGLWNGVCNAEQEELPARSTRRMEFFQEVLQVLIFT